MRYVVDAPAVHNLSYNPVAEARKPRRLHAARLESLAYELLRSDAPAFTLGSWLATKLEW